MKICLISNLFPPIERGGAEKVAQAMARGLRKAGHDVFIISTKPQGEFKQEIEDNLKIYRFRPLNIYYYLNDFKHHAIVRLLWHFFDIFNFHSYFVIKKILINEKPDLVISHCLMGIGFLLPTLIKRLKIKHFHVIHDVQLAVPSGLILKCQENNFAISGFLTNWYTKLCAKLFSGINLIISPSKWLLDFYLNKDFFKQTKTVVLTNPLQTQPFDQPKKCKQNKYLFIGQIKPHKGIQWLIDVWEKNNLMSELIIIGDGDKLIVQKQNIKVIGRKNQQEIMDQFQQIDFLIMPSLCYENSPTLIPLSFACATPLIVANIGGAGEAVNETNGFKFESKDEADFLQKLRQSMELPNAEYTKLSQNCLLQAKNYSFDTYISQILANID